ncbi:MAG: hypothetical protein ACD_38C00151G0002 [uncultured bacterium]|uniref:Phospholipid-binding protein, PBP family n=1 Tax=Candidatus Daviesbacteria bacterium GW2011_GWC2_40_12 TaxID=1618431 RepID=A0A0G0QQG4_9BACT|nr:MAG: hypothetical protein ACD_38C00151G0002 [uncultured bacterium]KKQ82751.1 MAG: Phospholipid-binding protein, PBP family [Candidatus Daviesbacteria bacterium GW2011_GWF2_38_7]KKR42388.1 MAG: Phospholipid-binding protein, PBP family [Candidatus Daviesbacteria bacterium GW2011_GWC2_40_12]OGE22304.1 MAG: hypothetical protein A2778_00445 [Candidatus Daviesbacteria bacterium RIFCSPHIGHO2_01_FULL_40_24]OGE28391.1 MAG: hypothetical protein A3C29_05440 [Candidatus Daviesbacteria bacterium RIFCSPHI
MKIQSPAFAPEKEIPQKYTCEGENISPPLEFSGVPANTKSLVLIVEDPDAPGNFIHWLVFNIEPQTKKVREADVPDGGMLGLNDFGKTTYKGPCPPSGTHRYFFKLFALNDKLPLPENASYKEVFDTMQEKLLDAACIYATYTRKTPPSP